MAEALAATQADTETWTGKYIELRKQSAEYVRQARELGKGATALATQFIAEQGLSTVQEVGVLRAIFTTGDQETSRIALSDMTEEMAALRGIALYEAKERVFRLMDDGLVCVNSDFTVRFVDSDSE